MGWNLLETSGWYPKLAYTFWFQNLFVFYIVNKQKNKKPAKIMKIAVLQNLRFLSRAESETETETET
jgi:hypothetical protein